MSSEKHTTMILSGGSGVLLTLWCLVVFATAPAYAQESGQCGSLENAYGPFDYTNAFDRREKLPVVERVHYDAGVQSLRGSRVNPGTPLASDLDYVLRTFPNHHKALYSIIKYDLSEDPRHQRKLRYSINCYFERASIWRPNDAKVHLLWGIYLSKRGNMEAAKRKFAQAESLMPGSAEVHYNIGLMLAKNKEYTEARRHAKTAYELGYPMPGLRNILKRAGEWQEVSP